MKDLIAAILGNPEFMNAVITAIAGIASYAVARLFAAKPAWEKYKGLLITSVKLARKIVPEGSTNQGINRAQTALKVFEEQYENAYGVFPTEKILQVAKLALPIVHDQLKAEGTL